MSHGQQTRITLSKQAAEAVLNRMDEESQAGFALDLKTSILQSIVKTFAGKFIEDEIINAIQAWSKKFLQKLSLEGIGRLELISSWKNEYRFHPNEVFEDGQRKAIEEKVKTSTDLYTSELVGAAVDEWVENNLDRYMKAKIHRILLSACYDEIGRIVEKAAKWDKLQESFEGFNSDSPN